MDKVQDHVCGMMVEPDRAVRITYNSKVYHVCSDSCGREFQKDPERYSKGYDPAYTVTGKVAAPRFGSAGSGGLENEPTPDAPRKR